MRKKTTLTAIICLLILMVLNFSAFAANIPSLITDLGDWNKDKATKASEQLALIGKPAVPELIKALSSKRTHQRRYAARALRQIGQDAADAIPALTKSLKDSDDRTREYAVQALGKMVEHRNLVMPQLQKATKDANRDVREAAKLAIDRFILIGLSKYEIENQVKILINQAKGPKCITVALTEESLNKYTGYVEFDNGVKTTITVTISGGNIQYTFGQAISGAYATKKKNLEEEQQRKFEIAKHGPPAESTTSNVGREDINEPIRTKIEVFGIPLNATLQEVVDTLEKNGIKIARGYLEHRGDIVSDANKFREVLQREINTTYDFWKISIPRKEKCLKLLEEGKLKGFCYEYKGEKYFIKPTSLMILLNVKQFSSNPGIYPVLEDFPDIYNSQFLLECEDFPAKMDSQGIRKMLIFFKSIEQKEPTCFLIRVIFGDKQPSGLSKLLTDKYGTPKLCYSQDPPVDNYGEIPLSEMGWAADLPKYINWNHPFREGDCNDSLWGICGKVNDATLASCGKRLDTFPYLKLIRGKDLGRFRSNFLFEWDYGNTLITLYGEAFCLRYKSDIALVFVRLDYIDLPSVVELSSMYEKLYSASEEAKAKVSESGKKGF